MSGLDFIRSEGLRHLLVRLHQAGPSAWRDDAEAADLMAYTIDKYGALARRHHLEPEDAAVAAFEVMRTRSARSADDPWAVVTRAVQVTLIAEERANGLLCSTQRARRATVSVFHDAERFSDRETPLTQYHPAFHVTDDQESVAGLDDTDNDLTTSAYAAVDSAVVLFEALGWPRDVVRATLEYICARLVEAGSRSGAHEILRRDHHARALLDLDRTSWASVLRVVLGNPNPDRVHTEAGRGLLLRLLIGHNPVDLLADDEFVAAVSSSAAEFVGRADA